MGIHETRYANFNFLLEGFQLNRGGVERGLLRDFGIAVGISDRQLSHLKCQRRNIGTATARQIERSLGLEDGWMDVPHGADIPMTDRERGIVDLILALYRASPVDTQEAILNLLKEQVCKNNNTLSNLFAMRTDVMLDQPAKPK